MRRYKIYKNGVEVETYSERISKREEILKEIKSAVADGVVEIMLLGQNVNSYGKNLETSINFAELLREICKVEGLHRVRFMTSHPKDLSDELIQVMSEESKICSHLHLPLQSGSTDILTKMNRRYSKEDYLTLVEKIKKACPDISLTTDIIVGFPNETEEQFEDTLKLVDACQFDNSFTFIYSPRIGTPAAAMEDNVAMEDKERRLQTLMKHTNHWAKVKNEAYEGQIVEVLVDGPSKKNPNVFSGYTPQNKLVNFTGENFHCGDIIKVEITEAKSFSLDGKAI